MNKNTELKKNILLPIVETFHSIQGEGHNIGKAAFFIRVGGCDVCCTWCDEKKSWDESIYTKKNITELLQEVINSKAEIVVLTGGEPFRYDLTQFTKSLKSMGIQTMAETSGTEKITGIWDWIVISPKQHRLPLEENYFLADEIKIVIQKEKDLDWAEKVISKTKNSIPKYLQPEWSCFEEIIPIIIDYIKKHPIWRLSVQVHKFLKIP